MIRSKPSRSGTDAEIVVDRILNRFRISQGWHAESPEDHALRVAAWLEVLGVARVPVEEYDDLYRRALRTRIEREAAGEKLYAMAPGDLVAEYRAKMDRAPKDLDPVGECPDRHEHRAADEPLRDYGFPGEAEEWLPCHVCRPSAFRQRVIEVREKRNAMERERKVVARVLGLMAGPRPVETSAIDAELDQVTAARREHPGDVDLQQRYAELVAEKARISKRHLEVDLAATTQI